jgi:hypothetical protein
VLLVGGYAVAIAVLVRARPVLRERRVWWFVALEAGTLAVALGLVLRGRLPGAALNVALAAGFALVWWWTGLRAQGRGGPGRYVR